MLKWEKMSLEKILWEKFAPFITLLGNDTSGTVQDVGACVANEASHHSVLSLSDFLVAREP